MCVIYTTGAAQLRRRPKDVHGEPGDEAPVIWIRPPVHFRHTGQYRLGALQTR